MKSPDQMRGQGKFPGQPDTGSIPGSGLRQKGQRGGRLRMRDGSCGRWLGDKGPDSQSEDSYQRSRQSIAEGSSILSEISEKLDQLLRQLRKD